MLSPGRDLQDVFGWRMSGQKAVDCAAGDCSYRSEHLLTAGDVLARGVVGKRERCYSWSFLSELSLSALMTGRG